MEPIVSDPQSSRRRSLAAVSVAALVAVTVVTLLNRTPAEAAVSLPPPHPGFDYQLGGAYDAPAGVEVVSRDRSAAPAAGKYNICYVNAFQAIEPDNYDSYTRSKDLLRATDAKAFLKLLADDAHAQDLAVAQKNTLELAGDREAVGLGIVRRDVAVSAPGTTGYLRKTC
jgi:hypothetical protein